MVEDCDVERFGGYERHDDGRATLHAAARELRKEFPTDAVGPEAQAQPVTQADLDAMGGLIPDDELHEFIASTRDPRDEEIRRLKEALAEIGCAVSLSRRCNHPPDDGSDDPCDSEDCFHCFVMARAALAAKPEAEGEKS